MHVTMTFPLLQVHLYIRILFVFLLLRLRLLLLLSVFWHACSGCAFFLCSRALREAFLQCVSGRVLRAITAVAAGWARTMQS